ncbi:hypothetical protein AWB78_01933 [Caballeronia calidae]|uniref:Uncharacterized protein n=1 Tax=Caballeronia calidae TaxID=1777139 RepID=A0A158AT11_9BURK|nr:hypothetical protein AWB78_01933 [Caballeronia calidae]
MQETSVTGAFALHNALVVVSFSRPATGIDP